MHAAAPTNQQSPLRALWLGAIGVVSAIFVVGGLATRGEPVAQARADRELGRLIEEIAAPVRSALLVRLQAPGELVAVDAAGAETHFLRRGGDLVVGRPGGSQGVLLSGLEDLAFDTHLVRRLREAPPIVSPGVFVTPPSAADAPDERRVQAVEPGSQIAVGFSVPGTAPAAARAVKGVGEQLLAARIAEAGLPLRRRADSSGPTHLDLVLCPARGLGDARPIVGDGVLARTRLALADLPVDGPDAQPVTLDLTGLRTREPLEPGLGYSLLLEPVGGTLVVEVSASDPAHDPGVALRAGDHAPWERSTGRVALRLSGPRRLSQTVLHEVVESVDMSLAFADGRSLRVPMVVAGQSAAQNPWLGVVPGELPPLASGRATRAAARSAQGVGR